MFIVSWVFDKLGYMPKIDMQVGKVNLDTKIPDFKMWPFPVVEVTSLSEIPNATTVTAIKKSRKAVAKKTARKPKAK